jgi:hypothetical protein
VTYSSEVLADSPLGFWKLDETSGSSAADSSGNSHGGTYQASPTLAAASVVADGGTAVTLNGSTQYVSVAGASWMNTSDYSIEAWVKTSLNNFYIASRAGSTAAQRVWDVFIRTVGTVAVVTWASGGTNTQLNGTIRVDDGKPHHIVVTKSGTTISIYVDGVLDVSGTTSTTNTSTTQGIDWGRRSTNASFFNGTLDDVAVYGSALSGTRVAAHFTAGNPTPAIGRATETDTARALTATKVVAIGRASETDTGRTLTSSHVAALGRAATVAAALALTATQFVAIGRAAETDTARTLGTPSSQPLGRAAETDSARPFTATQFVPIGRATETDAARSLTATQRAAVNRATETDTARPLSPTRAPAIGSATETDTARALTTVGAGTFVLIGRATETDEARPLAAATDPNIGQTQLSWNDGRRRDGTGVAFWEPPVVPPPRTVRPEVTLIKAYVYDSVTIDGGLAKPVHRMASHHRRPYRITVSGKDVTFFRGVQTPEPQHGLIEPLLYGSGSITWPQIHAAFEKPGTGALHWLKPQAPVRIQRVRSDGSLVTDYRGLIADFGSSGRQLVTALDGEATGRAQMYRPQPIFPKTEDIGHLGIKAVRHALRLPTMDNPPETGIKIPDSGDKSQLDFLNDLTARSTTLTDKQWTIMPNTAGRYQMFRKDTTTIDFTVYCDDSRTRADLRRDFAEESDRVFVTAIDGDSGMRIRFIQDPGMDSGDHPPGFPGHMAQGDTGRRVFELTWRLWTVGFLPGGDGPDAPDTFTAKVTKAVRRLQDRADLDITGEVNQATWRAAFDNDLTGWSLRRTRIKPAAVKPWVEAFKTNASGQILGRNRRYRRKAVLNDRIVDMGTVDSRDQAQDWAEAELSDDNTPNLVGTIDITMGAVISGEHHPGDPLASDDLLDARAVKPGMNALVHFQGDAHLMHVATRDLNADRTVQIAVDTRARNALDVWSIHERNREARRSPMRQWKRENRSSTLGRDSMTGWDEIGGKVDTRVFLAGHTWRVFPVVAGEEGQIREVKFITDDDPAEFVLAMFGKKISAATMARLVGNPLTDQGKRNWRRHGDKLRDSHLWLYEAGWEDNPCGYHPSTKVEAKKDFPEKGSKQVTGKWVDAAGFPYFCADNVIWVAMYASWDTFVQPGRVMKIQLNDQI